MRLDIITSNIIPFEKQIVGDRWYSGFCLYTTPADPYSEMAIKIGICY